MLSSTNLNDLFDCSKQHPPILKKFLSGKISLENMVIYDMIFSYVKNFDKKIQDPIWKSVSVRIRKYKPFLNIDIFNYKKILQKMVLKSDE